MNNWENSQSHRYPEDQKSFFLGFLCLDPPDYPIPSVSNNGLSMYSEVHANRVLYKQNPEPGQRYRQIAVIEGELFEVRIFSGDVIHTDPKFIAYSSEAEVHFHASLQPALADVDKEFNESVAAGWIPYTPNR
jgi:hypothetical protein